MKKMQNRVVTFINLRTKKILINKQLFVITDSNSVNIEASHYFRKINFINSTKKIPRITGSSGIDTNDLLR